MCFTYDETYEVTRETYRRARKPHNCAGCDNKIQPGDRYWSHFGVMRGEKPDTWNECESCRYHLAMIYACEIAEGCRPHESWYPLEMIQDEMHDRCWYVPGVTGDTWKPEDDDDGLPLGVVRFGQWMSA